MVLDFAVIAAYVLGMLGIGWWGARRTATKSDYLVAGRRLGGFLYAGTMSAVVLGGASTVGGVGLGYRHGLSGAWLVLTIGLGILLLSTFLARRIARLRVYTVAEMLDLRYGSPARRPGAPGGSATGFLSGAVMWAYTLMLTVTNTLAFSAIFNALFDMPRAGGVLIGGGVVVLYSALGGMWSITITDIAQFAIQTVGVFLLLLPMVLSRVGGLGSLSERLGPETFDLGHIGAGTIATYLLTYMLGLLIGQDVWQRVATARSHRVATLGGISSGVYCLLYAFAGALIGTATKALYPNLSNADDAFTTIVRDVLPTGVRGLVLAAALAAVMSTASGGLIACSTVAANDLWPRLRRAGRSRTDQPRPDQSGSDQPDGDDVRTNRLFTAAIGLLAIGIAVAVADVVAALTVAYNILVGGLLVPIVGGLLWKRGTRQGALTGMLAGTAVVLATMALRGILANEPIYCGLLASLLAYVLVSLRTARTDPEVLQAWEIRLAGEQGARPEEPEQAGRAQA